MRLASIGTAEITLSCFFFCDGLIKTLSINFELTLSEIFTYKSLPTILKSVEQINQVARPGNSTNLFSFFHNDISPAQPIY